MDLNDAVIVSTARTPIGRAHKGSLVDVPALDLAELAITAAIDRSGVPRSEIDDIVFAESLQGGGVMARHVAVRLGMTTVPGAAVNRHCAGSLTAISMGAAAIRSGMESVVLAGGVESMSTRPDLFRDGERWKPLSHPLDPEAPPTDMSITVGENTARLANVSRAEADAWACRSHRRAVDAIDDGRFSAEVVPVGDFAVDEHPRRETTLERLAALPVLHPGLPGATVTAGNSAGLNDAAAAVMLTSAAFARAHGLTPLARVWSWASVGVEPARTGLSPTVAVPLALSRAGVAASDIDLFEINEAFCAMAVASTRILGLDEEQVNVNGSGCSLGHPIAATGARMVVSTVAELRRREASLACLSMCSGGGMGAALVLELLGP